MKDNKWIIIAVVAIAILFLAKGNLNFLGAVTQSSTVTRDISAAKPGETVTVRLDLVGGTGKFGGIVGETIPAGFTVLGIQSSSLGVSGSASGKLTGQLYEVAFAVDNIATPYISYTLASPSNPGNYQITGTFQYAEGGPSGTIGGESQFNLCQPVCTRPADLCISSSNDGCGGTCPWTVTKNSEADTNCDNHVVNNELISAIQKWVSNTAPFNSNLNLLNTITAWVNS